MSKASVTFAGSAAAPDQFPRDGIPEVAFLGRSNVGKSSLLNALLGAKNLARVSSTPGRTRLVNFFRVGSEMYFVDLPGYGYAKLPETLRHGFERLATSYLVDRLPLALCVFLVDSRHDPTAGDQMLKRFLEQNDLPHLIAATKADKLGGGELERHCMRLRRQLRSRAQDVVAVSAATGIGLQELWGRIREAAEARRQESRHEH